MDDLLGKLIEVNISGRVFAICHSRGVLDPVIIRHYTDFMRQAVWTDLGEDCSLEEFNQVLEQQAVWLESEIDQTRPHTARPVSNAVTDAATAASRQAVASPAPPAIARKKATGYVPRAKSMPERLADYRANMERLLKKDCVDLNLITPNQAKMYNRRLLAEEPQQAEREIVAELCKLLHAQLRKFIRKHKGGPWGTATLQNELREDIVSTRTLRSLATLARELLLEREAWLKQNKLSLTGRLFGGKLNF